MNTNNSTDKSIWSDGAFVAPIVVAFLASFGAGFRIISAGGITDETAVWTRVAFAVSAFAACVAGGAALVSRRKGDRKAMGLRFLGAGFAVGISLFALASATMLVKLRGFVESRHGDAQAEVAR